MKTLVLLIVPVALLCAADQKTDAKKPAPKPAAVQSIPAGATQVEPYLYRFQDADGKKWLYRQTPFGVVKMEEKPAAAVVEDNSNPVAVTDQGETVKFEKKTPFGVQSWTRKKTELSDTEKAMMQDGLHESPAKGLAGGRDTEKQ